MRMSSEFVVGVECIGIKEADETNRAPLVYRFEVTWSDESKTTKKLTSDDLHLFRRQLKAEIYKNLPEFPEVPDGKAIGSLISKAKKMEKRKKAIEEFCAQIINLPHQPGKLQAIRNLFLATTEGQTTGYHLPRKSDEDDDAKVVVGSSLSSEERKREGGGEGGGRRSSLQYVQLEFLNRQKSVTTKTAPEPIYAEVVLLEASMNTRWLSQLDEGSEENGSNRRDSQIACPSSPSYSRSDSSHQIPCPLPPASSPPPPPPSSTPQGDAVVASAAAAAKKTKVSAAKEANEMLDCDELTPKRPTSASSPPSPSSSSVGCCQQPLSASIFDAAMLSNFPDGTLVPLPPCFTPEQCPASPDLKLTKNAEPLSDDMHLIYVVSICDWRSKVENTLTFKRGQKALLHYTSSTWWFISTRHSVGWVPADYWRIVTDWKTVSGKPLGKFAPWNFGVLGRKECEEMLRRGNQQNFLIRESAHATGHLVLSVLHNSRVHHFEIQMADQGLLYIGQHHFRTIHNVVLYYKKKALFNDESGNDFRLGRFFLPPET